MQERETKTQRYIRSNQFWILVKKEKFRKKHN